MPLSVCQNDGWRSSAPIEINDIGLCSRYVQNQLTSAIVFGGLEPFEQFGEMKDFIHTLRIVFGCCDDIVIYTGYYPEEIKEQIEALSKYKNIVIKFGRFIPNSVRRFDGVLGVELASENQYAERIS